MKRQQSCKMKNLKREARKTMRSPSLTIAMNSLLGMLEARKELPAIFGEWTETDQKKLEYVRQLNQEVKRQQATLRWKLESTIRRFVS